MKIPLLTLLFCCSLHWPVSVGVNILVVLPNVDYSQFKETSKLARQLSFNGYNVTILSPFALPESSINITQLLVSSDTEPVHNEKAKIYESGYTRDSYWSKLISHNAIGRAYLKLVVESDNFKTLVTSNSTFDLVILEDVGAYGLAVLSTIFQCPLVTLLSEPLSLFYENLIFDNIEWRQLNDLRTAHYWALKEFYKNLVILPGQNNLLKEVLPKAPDFKDVLYETSLILMPSYQTVGNLMPMYSHVKQIGGFNRLFIENVSTNIQWKFENMSKDVVVVSKKLPEFVKTELEKMDALSRFKIVYTSDVPDVIGNPNVRLFIGDGNVYETDIVASNGVPLVIICENIWDQQFLANSLTKRHGVWMASIKDKEVLEHGIMSSDALQLLLKRDLVLLSSVMKSERDQENGMKKAIFWIEQVLKNGRISDLQQGKIRWMVNNRWLTIVIVLVLVDIALCLLFYWIFTHFGRLVNRFYWVSVAFIFYCLGKRRTRDVNYIRIATPTKYDGGNLQTCSYSIKSNPNHFGD